MSQNVSLSGERACGKIKLQKEGRTAASCGRRPFDCPERGKTMNQSERSRALRMYFEEGREAEEIAQALGMTAEEVEGALGDPEALEHYRKKSEMVKIRAQIRMNESAERAARKQAELLDDRENGGTPTVLQRAAKDILDRAGVRLAKEEKGEITIRFVSGVPELGMPRRREEQE